MRGALFFRLLFCFLPFYFCLSLSCARRSPIIKANAPRENPRRTESNRTARCRLASVAGVSDNVRGVFELKEEATIDCPWSRQTLTVERVSAARLPTEVGEFRIAGYRSKTSGEEFVALY